MSHGNEVIRKELIKLNMLKKCTHKISYLVVGTVDNTSGTNKALFS